MLLSIATPFIKRPVLTTVCTIIIVLVGIISMALLPLDKLPEIAPKRVRVTANFIGADARTTVENVTNVMEREINGTEDVRWIESFTDNTGQSSISVIFPTEIDRNTAQVLVQNRVTQAQPDIPQEVINAGIKTEKQSPSLTLIYGFYSEKDDNGEYLYNSQFIYNYADRYFWNDLKRIQGVGDIALFGSSKYAMRFWVDSDALAARGLVAQDVIDAINEQNLEVAGGKIGQRPTVSGQQYEFPVRIKGRFTSVEEAEDIVVQVGEDGTLIHLGDVGRVELGGENYNTLAIADGAPGVALLVYQLPGTNALETAKQVKAKMAEFEASFPKGMKVFVAQDNTLFVTASLKDLIVTLLQAIGLVVLIIFIFLQDWRTTVIPAIAIPVSLIGAMIALLTLGFTLNQLTLFACVLATGLVVDDGIVVVEAVSTKMSQGMRPMQAALDAMQELSGAVISTSLVLMAVFIPVSFFPGTTGIVYQQFALTIAFAIAISTFNALSFSPSMSAVILQPQKKVHGPLGGFFEAFNRFFDWFKGLYRKLIEFLVRIRLLVMVVFIAGLVLTGWMYQVIPQGFIPAEDQGYLFALGEAPAGVSLDYTHGISEQVDREVRELSDSVEHVLTLTGYSFDGQNSNKMLSFIKLHPWDERPRASQSVFGVINELNQRFARKISGARVFAGNAPPVDGLSNTDGSEIYIQDRSLAGIPALIDNTQRVIAAANQRPELAGAFSTFTFDSPMLETTIDRKKAKAQNVAIDDILSSIRTYVGSNFINRFVLDGRLYRVYAQADADLRSNPEDINRIYVRSRDGSQVQLSNLLSATQISYPPVLTNYQVYPAIKIIANPAPGYSTGQVIQIMEEIAEQELQPGFGYEWINTAKDEKESAGAAPVVFGLGFVMVFLVLAAQYESYVDPTIIMLTVPLAILGALSGIWFRATLVQPFNPDGAGIWPVLVNNIYVQVGLVMLIGMASKNAILIVEFANQARAVGMNITQAAIYAAEQRFRPILMTAISTLVGFLPLLIASGAGAISRWSLGTAVFGGMLISTILSLIIVPNLYIVIKSFEDEVLKGGPRKPRKAKPGQSEQPLNRPSEPALPEKEPALRSFKASPQNK